MPDMRSSVARTPLHEWHRARGARFAARAGFGLADVSAFAKLSLRGAVGASPGPRGVAVLAGDSGLACRLTHDHLLLLGSTMAVADLSPSMTAVPEGRGVVPTDVTSTYAGFELIGPRLEELLRRLTHLDVGPAALPSGSCAETSFAGVEALLVRPPGRSLPALRVYVGWDLGEYVWERMTDAGRDVPIGPLGLEALALLR